MCGAFSVKMFRCVFVLACFAAVGGEIYNAGSRCSSEEFTCGDGACVTAESRCDGTQHCADGSDEHNCGVGSNTLDLHDIVLHRYKRQSQCRKNQFACRDGNCVRFDQKCDGAVDCPDGSDETHPLCRNMRCPSNLFRCTYGACVDGTAACNQQKECADNSDELLPRCRHEVPEVKGKFTCKNGEKIPSTDHCDGVYDCADRSDESIETCAGKQCSSHLFQCAYGACVDSGADCDGKVDCVDGSDESNELCNTTTVTTPYTPMGNCILPEYPEHGTYTVQDKPFAKPGERYQSPTIQVTCNPGYGVVGKNYSHCFGQNEWTEKPTCSRFCRLTPDPSVTYHCKVTGAFGLVGTRRCHGFEPSGTIVTPVCNAPNYYYNGVLRNMNCIEGSWDYKAVCQPECGKSTPAGTPLIVNGVRVERGELPWHAGIYDKRNTPYLQICGGSLVSNTVVISAAHCFWDDAKGGFQSYSYYAVALGKLYRPWNNPVDVNAQKSEVSSIKITPRYLGEAGHYQEDIALVYLATAVVYVPYIRPVCLDFDEGFDKRQLHPNNYGKVTGWGIQSEDGKASPVLLTTKLPFIDLETCLARLPSDFKYYITTDKFCAGGENGTAVCKGDSGGGMVFPAIDHRGDERYYLRGIVSTAPRNDHACNIESYTSFTRILSHEGFIKDNI